MAILAPLDRRFPSTFQFLNNLTRSTNARPEESEKRMRVREATFASTVRGLKRSKRLLTPARIAIVLPNRNGTSRSMLMFTTKKGRNRRPLYGPATRWSSSVSRNGKPERAYRE